MADAAGLLGRVDVAHRVEAGGGLWVQGRKGLQTRKSGRRLQTMYNDAAMRRAARIESHVRQEQGEFAEGGHARSTGGGSLLIAGATRLPAQDHRMAARATSPGG